MNFNFSASFYELFLISPYRHSYIVAQRDGSEELRGLVAQDASISKDGQAKNRGEG